MGDIAVVAGEAKDPREAEDVLVTSYAIAHREKAAAEKLMKGLREPIVELLKRVGVRFCTIGKDKLLLKLGSDGRRTFLSPLDAYKAKILPLNLLLRCCSFSAETVDALAKTSQVSPSDVKKLVAGVSDGVKVLVQNAPE